MPTEGWVWVVLEGMPGLLLSSYLELCAAKAFACRVIYTFEAAEPTEMSVEEGTTLQMLPDASDPPGWCTAVRQRQQGLVPHTYVEPIPDERTSTVPKSQPLAHTAAAEARRRRLHQRLNEATTGAVRRCRIAAAVAVAVHAVPSAVRAVPSVCARARMQKRW